VYIYAYITVYGNLIFITMSNTCTLHFKILFYCIFSFYH